MALESFYGGKPGISPVIRASFKYISTEDPAYKAKKGHSVKVSDLSNREKALFEKILNRSLSDNDNVDWNETTLAPFTMDECFKDSTYHDVWYNELCIIDTENKLNPNNGKLFRRTLKRVDTVLNAGDTNYAEYIGQIVGPSGGVPNIRFGSIDDMRKQATGLQNTLPTDGINDDNPAADISSWDYSYPTKDENDRLIITTANPAEDNDNNRSNDYEKIAILDSKESGSIQVVPGKVNGTYNDDIKYTWCNVRRTLTNGNAQDAWIYLGFEIPYTVFDVAAEERPFTYDGPIFEHSQDTEINSEEIHPFYHNLKFYIPRGTRGIGPEEIILVRNRAKFFALSNENNTSSNEENENDIVLPKNHLLYYKDMIEYDIDTDTYSVKKDAKYLKDDGHLYQKHETTEETSTETEETPIETDVLKKAFWVAKWTLFNPKANQFETVYQFIDNYRDINDVELNTDIEDPEEYGNFTIYYSTEDKKTLQIPLVKSIDVNTTNNSDNYGKVTTTFSNGTDVQWEGTLPLIKSITYHDKKESPDDQEAGFYFEYAGNKTIHLNRVIHDIAKLEIINGHLYVTYKDTNGSTDLGLVKVSPTLGAVISDTINASTSTNPNEDVFVTTINNYCNNNLNSDTDYVKGNTTIKSDGTITVETENDIIDKTGGFILVTVNKAASGNNTPESKNYLCYYDVNQERWTAVSFSGGSGGSSAATNIYVNEGSTIFPSAGEVGEAEFKFDTVDELPSSSSSLLMPWSSSIL